MPADEFGRPFVKVEWQMPHLRVLKNALHFYREYRVEIFDRDKTELPEPTEVIIDMEKSFFHMDLTEMKNCEKAVDGMDVVLETSLLEHDVYLDTVWRRPRVEFDHYQDPPETAPALTSRLAVWPNVTKSVCSPTALYTLSYKRNFRV